MFLYDIERKDDRKTKRTLVVSSAPIFSILGKGSGWEAQGVRLIDFMRGQQMDWKHDLLLLCYVALGGRPGFCSPVSGGQIPEGGMGTWLSLGNGVCEHLWLYPGGPLCSVPVYEAAPIPGGPCFSIGGFIGGFTAFSSFIKEGLHFSSTGEHITGFLYILLQNTPGDGGGRGVFLGGEISHVKGELFRYESIFHDPVTGGTGRISSDVGAVSHRSFFFAALVDPGPFLFLPLCFTVSNVYLHAFPPSGDPIAGLGGRSVMGLLYYAVLGGLLVLRGCSLAGWAMHLLSASGSPGSLLRRGASCWQQGAAGGATHPVVRQVTYTTDKPIPGPYKVVFVSDLHFGGLFGTEYGKELAARINGQQPDLILLGGDIVDGDLPFVQQEGSLIP